jgi:hypothetical protein
LTPRVWMVEFELKTTITKPVRRQRSGPAA